MEFLRNPMFWIAVIVVAVVVNFIMTAILGKGKLV